MEANTWHDHITQLNELLESVDRAGDLQVLTEVFREHFQKLAPEARAYCLWVFRSTKTQPDIVVSEHYCQYLPTPASIPYIKSVWAKFVQGTRFMYRPSLQTVPDKTPLFPDVSAGISSDIVLPLPQGDTIGGVLHVLGETKDCFPERIRELMTLAFAGFARKYIALSDAAETIDGRRIEDEDNIIQQIIDTVPNYIYVKDESSNFVLVNQAVADLFETTKEDIVKKGLPFIEKHKVNIVLDQSTDRRVLQNLEVVESVEKMSLATGENRWVRTTKIPLVLKSGKVLVLGVSVDITPIKMQTQTLEEAKHLKEQFLANISHELRTPINGIVGMIKMLEGTPTLPEQKKYLDAIRKSSETLQVLINDILDFSVIESGNIRFNKIGFNPKSLCTALVESFRYDARKKGLQLTLNYDPYVDKVLIGDPVRLNQILINVLSNAVKFTQKGYVRIYVLRQNDNREKARLRFIIEDSGIGINRQDLGRIFDSFEQANDKIARKYGGTGLGLSIVKQLVELQQGSIEVESDAGKGTRFTIDLTFAVGTEKDLDLQQDYTMLPTSPSQSLSPDATCRILVVEDNEVNLLYSKMLLEKWSCVVDSASNGVEALEKLKANSYDIILMDMLMPVMDGEEATIYIRNQLEPPKSETCIIAITANALDNDIDRYKNAGVDDCLTKPYTPAELRGVMLKNLENKKTQDSTQETDKNDHVVDLQYLKHLSNNDVGFIREMIESFKRESPKDIETMHLAARQNKWQQVRDIAHKIKPSLTFMGMHKTYDLLNNIRQAAIAEDIEETRRLIKVLDASVKKAVEELRTYYLS